MMSNAQSGWYRWFFLLLIVVGAGMGASCWGADDEVVPLLRTKLETYTNVTITARTDTKVTIMHAGGIGEVFFEDVLPEDYGAVGYEAPVAASDKLRGLVQAVQSEGGMQGGAGGVENVEISPLWIGVIVVVGLVFYVFGCYCYGLICRKAGEEPGVLIWVPILQIFPLLKAAGMSPWWALAFLVPLLNIVAGILWCFKIVQARGKHVIWAVLLLLPFTNFVAFLYLAFSSAAAEAVEAPPVRESGFVIR
ncbi:MAG: hypothetical protein RI897_4571 [Verrucomicrobiota bacterium]|jgi:hypothetical protein